jgi:hypothetical protein
LIEYEGRSPAHDEHTDEKQEDGRSEAHCRSTSILGMLMGREPSVHFFICRRDRELAKECSSCPKSLFPQAKKEAVDRTRAVRYVGDKGISLIPKFVGV